MANNSKVKNSKKNKNIIKKDCQDCSHYLLSKVNYNNKTPILSLHHNLHVRDKYRLDECEQEEKLAFVKKMIELSNLTWLQIMNAPRHGLGTEKIQRIEGDTLPSSIREDTQLLALRFFGMKPMVGFRDNDIFHVLWFDRDCSLYSH